MFLMAVVFGIVLLLTFTVVLLLTSPTQHEKVIEGRISKLGAAREEALAAQNEAEQIVKETEVSQVAWLNSLMKNWRLTEQLQLLITQADSSWSVMSVLGATVLIGLLAYAVGWYEMGSATIALVPALAFAPVPLLILRFQRARLSRCARSFGRSIANRTLGCRHAKPWCSWHAAFRCRNLTFW